LSGDVTDEIDVIEQRHPGASQGPGAKAHGAPQARLQARDGRDVDSVGFVDDVGFPPRRRHCAGDVRRIICAV